MTISELDSIRDELATSGPQSHRGSSLVKTARCMLWPFIRSFHFITVAWTQSKFEAQQREIQSLRTQLDEQRHAAHKLRADLDECLDLARNFSERLRITQAETLAVSRQSEDIGAEVQAHRLLLDQLADQRQASRSSCDSTLSVQNET